MLVSVQSDPCVMLDLDPARPRGLALPCVLTTGYEANRRWSSSSSSDAVGRKASKRRSAYTWELQMQPPVCPAIL